MDKIERKAEGIFGKNPKMSPENVKRWFALMRAELGWTIAEAAAHAEADATDIEAIERTGETEMLAREVRHLAGVYCRAMYGEGMEWSRAWMYGQDSLAYFGDKLHLASFEVGGLLRRQRIALGLSVDEVAAAVGARDPHLAGCYEDIEWGQGIDSGNGFDTIGAVLKLPAVEILRLNGCFSIEDLEAWFAWRAARGEPGLTAETAVAR